MGRGRVAVSRPPHHEQTATFSRHHIGRTHWLSKIRNNGGAECDDGCQVTPSQAAGVGMHHDVFDDIAYFSCIWLSSAFRNSPIFS